MRVTEIEQALAEVRRFLYDCPPVSEIKEEEQLDLGASREEWAVMRRTLQAMPVMGWCCGGYRCPMHTFCTVVCLMLIFWPIVVVGVLVMWLCTRKRFNEDRLVPTSL